MSKRKGELSANQIDREFPHQVMVLASSVAGMGSADLRERRKLKRLRPPPLTC
jgi:hypothetical protein